VTEKAKIPVSLSIQLFHASLNAQARHSNPLGATNHYYLAASSLKLCSSHLENDFANQLALSHQSYFDVLR
jgi:hypothetical protein